MDYFEIINTATNEWLKHQEYVSISLLEETFTFINENLAKEMIKFWLEHNYIQGVEDLYKVVPNNIENNKLIFLDIDGVLNHSKSNDALDEQCLDNLSNIVDKSHAKIILISSWKSGWNEIDKDNQDEDANYLDSKLKEHKIYISHKSSRYAYGRTLEVVDYIMKYVSSNYVILDDESSCYIDTPLYKHLVNTSYYDGGLTKQLSDLAISILNN